MRPIRLTIKGLNSFIEEQTIHFEKLTAQGLFGIFGPTGSGKSSILDGMTLALYGEIARKSKEYINVNCTDMHVSFEFQVSTATPHRYEVTRHYRKDKKTGKIRTHSVLLVEKCGAESIILADSVNEVDKRCIQIIGLGLEDFTRTVVLPQGKFSDFLKLEGKSRRDMLERLFNLEKYGDELSTKLSSKMKTEIAVQNQLIGEINSFEGLDEAYLKQKEILYKEEVNKLEQLKKKKQKVELEYKESEEIWNLQQEAKKYEVEKACLQEKEEDINKDKECLEYAKKALKVLPLAKNYEAKILAIKEAENRLLELNQSVAHLQEEKTKLTALFEEALKQKESKEPLFKLQLDQLQEAIKEITYIEGLEEGTGEAKGIKQIRVILKQLSDRIYKYLDEIEEEKAVIKKLASTINEEVKREQTLKVDDIQRKAVEEGLRLLQKFSFEEEHHKKMSLENKKLQKQHSIVTKEAHNSFKEYSEINKALATALDHQKQFEIAPTLTDDRLIQVRQEALNSKEQYTKLQEKIEQLDKIKQCMQDREEELKKLEAKGKQQKVKVETLKEKIEKIKLKQATLNLQHTLQLGEKCPLCGGVVHHLEEVTQEEVLIVPFEEQLKEEEAELENLRRQYFEEQAELKGFKQEGKKLQEEIQPLEAKFKEKSIDRILEEAEALQKQYKENEIKRQQLDLEVKRVQARKNEIEVQKAQHEAELTAITEQLQKNDKETSEVQLRLNGLRESIEKLKQTSHILDFEQKSQWIKEVDTEREALRSKLSELREKKEVLSHKQQEQTLAVSKYTAQFAKGRAQLEEKEKRKQELLVSLKARLEKTELKGNHDIDFLARGEAKEGLFEDIKGDEVLTENMLDHLYEMYPIKGEKLQVLHNRLNSTLQKLQEALLKLEEEVEQKEQAKKKIDEMYDKKNKIRIELKSHKDTLEGQLQVDKEQLDEVLKKTGLMLEEVTRYALTEEEVSILQNKIDQYSEKLNKLKGALEAVTHKLNGRVLEDEAWESIKLENAELALAFEKQSEEEKKLKLEIEEIANRLDKVSGLLERKKKQDYKIATLKELESLFKGKKFVEFVATAKLKYVCLEASKRLREISNGQYGLEVDENSRFAIRDYKNGGKLRAASTLSGGETFLVSLSLALSLSAVIQLKNAAPLEFFFLDEGFGTLDDELLETVIGSLEKIHNDHLKIGIISHVEAIKNRVPIKLILTPAEPGKGGTKIKLDRN